MEAKPSDVPMADPHPDSLWPVVGHGALSVAKVGSYAFGAYRDRGKRYSAGIEIGGRHRCCVHAPLPGDLVAIRHWSRDHDGSPLLVVFVRAERYIFAFGGIIPDTSPIPGIYVRPETSLGRSRRGIHVSMFEPIHGETEGDFVARMMHGGMVWRVNGRVPGGLRNPQHFLEAAAAVQSEKH